MVRGHTPGAMLPFVPHICIKLKGHEKYLRYFVMDLIVPMWRLETCGTRKDPDLSDVQIKQISGIASGDLMTIITLQHLALSIVWSRWWPLVTGHLYHHLTPDTWSELHSFITLFGLFWKLYFTPSSRQIKVILETCNLLNCGTRMLLLLSDIRCWDLGMITLPFIVTHR